MPSIADIKSQYPELSGLDDNQVVDAIHQAFYEDLPRDQVAGALGVKPLVVAEIPKPRTMMQTIGDAGVTALKGAIGVPEAVVGMADLLSGGRVGKALENEGGSIGFRPKQAKAMLDDYYSEQQKQAFRNVSDADGVLGTAKAALENPSVIAHAVGESIPMIGMGGLIGRGVMAAAPRVGALGAGAVGEGVVAAGSAGEQIRQQTEDGLLTGKQAALGTATGFATGAFGVLGGKIAQRLGIADVDTMLAAAGKNQAVRKGVVRSVLEGAASEGLLEELPQSVSEQVLQNIALNRPLDDGVDQAIVLGTLSGAAMGGGANAVNSFASGGAEARGPEPVPQTAPVPPVETPGPMTKAVNAISSQNSTAAAEASAGSPWTGPSITEPSAQFVDSPVFDRILTVQEALQDPAVREKVRARWGEDGLNNIAYYAGIASRSGIPDKTQDNALSMAERLLSESVLTPIQPAPEIGGARRDPMMLNGSPVQETQAIGMDDAPSGRFTVDSQGRVMPESRVQKNDAQRQAEELRNLGKAETGRRSDAQAQTPMGEHLTQTSMTNLLAARQDPLAGALATRRQAIHDMPAGMAQRRNTDGKELNLKADDPVAGYIEDLRNTNTPAARAYVGDFDAGRVTRADVEQRMQADRGKTADERLAEAAAEGLKLNPKGDPFKTLMAANLAAKTTPGTVIEVPGGYAIRPQESTVANTKAQNAAIPEAIDFSPAQEAGAGRRADEAAGSSSVDARRDESFPADEPAAADTTGEPALQRPVARSDAGALNPGQTPRTPVDEPRSNAANPGQSPSATPVNLPLQPRSTGHGTPANVQDAPQAANDTAAETPAVEAPAPARGDGAAAAGVPDAGAGAGVRADGVKPAGQRQLSADEQAAQDREAARAKEPSLPPVLSARLQEAHKAHGRDVKRSVVERSIANEKANNTGTPKARRERADRIARLEADLALFDEAAGLSKNPQELNTPAEPVQKTAESEQVQAPQQDPDQQRRDFMAAEKKRADKRARLTRGEWEKNPLREFLGRHGVSMDLAKEFAPGTKERRKAMVAGHGPIFRKAGKNIDMLAEAAAEEGFTSGEDADALYELIGKVFRGERVAPLFADGVAESEMEARMKRSQEESAAGFDDFVSQQEEAGDPLASLMDDDYTLADIEGSGYAQASPELKAEVAALSAQLEAMGVDVESIVERVAQQTIDQTDQEYHEELKQALQQAYAEQQAAQPGSLRNTGEDGRSQTGETESGAGQEGLTTPTKADIEAQQARAEQAARDKAAADRAAERTAAQEEERKRIAKASEQAADTFELGGDAMANLTGQKDIFGAAESEAETPRLTPAEATELMEWQSLGTKDGVTKHILTFYESKADKDAKRGRMIVATVAKGDRSATAWMVDGDDQTFGPLALAKKRGMEIGMAKAKTDGFVQMSALEQALGADVMSRPVDKAAKLRKDADKLAAEARKMLEGIEPGQPIMSTRDRNLRERSVEKMRKAAELNTQADALDAAKPAAPAQQEATQATDDRTSTVKESLTTEKPAQEPATDDRDTFTLKRLNRETNKMEPVTFKRGEYIRHRIGDKDHFGEIDGISQARREFSVDGLWYPMGFANKAERPAAPVRKDMAPLSSVIDKVNAKNGEGLTDADRVPEQKPASKTPTVDRHEALMKSVREGKTTAEQFKAAFESLVANKDAVLAELETKTKAELLKAGGYFIQMRYASEKKGEVIDAIYRQMVGNFVLGETLSYGMGKGAFEAAVRRHVEATDDAKLEQYAKDRQAAIAEAQAERAAKAAAMDNPQTLADFKAIIAKHIGEGKSAKDAFLSLTPEQRIQFDTLAAESTREAREARKRERKTEVRAAGQTTGGEIIATKHTRDNYDLFVVKLADRLSREDYTTVLASAKKLGGWYSAFRGNGAIPGFQFKDKANAEAFLKLAGGDTADAQAQADQRRDAFEDDRSETAVERLRTMADKLAEQAAEIENADRKTNTARRARFAASALNGAAEMKAKASTMRNIAQAIEAGGAKFLDAVRTKSQVDLLTGIVATAKNNELRAKYPSYADQEKRRGEPATDETADFAEFPAFTAYRSDLASLGRQLLEVDGTKKLGQRLMSVADDVSDAYLEFAKQPANLFKLSTFSVKRGDEVKAAIFPNREQAERAIARSGLTGKAIVLAEKRGVNRIIMSPSEAINAGIWTGDGDKRITLSADFGNELVEAIGRRGNKSNKLTVPWQFQNAYDRRKALSRLGIETPSEYRSALREFIGLQERAIANKVKEMELAMVGRKADGLDFFPTPAEVADQMVEAADIEAGMLVLEPSGGMAHIADRIRAAGAEPDVGEISEDRRELLQEKGYNLVARDFMEFTAPAERGFTFGDLMRAPDGTVGILRGQGGMGSDRVRLVSDEAEPRELGKFNFSELEGVERRGSMSGYDRILMNPPFSNRRDAEHVQHAYTLLKPGGRIVAIMGEGVFFGQDKKAQEFRDWLESVGGTSEKLPPGSFMDPSLPVNTGVSARMVVIDKPAGDVKFSIDDGTGPADTADYGPATQAHRDAAARLAESFADRIESGGSHTDLLDAVAPGDGKRGQAAAAVASIARRLFRRQVVFVKFKGTPLFNGVVSKSVPGVVFLNIDSQKPLLSVLGHELLHEMAKSHPTMYANLSRRLDDLIKNETEYAVRTYNAYKKAGISTKGLDTREELEADIVGDNFMDAGFWQAMGENQPGLFKRIVNFVTKWLDNLAEKIADYRPFGTDEFLTDIAAARDAVAGAMREFSGAEAGAVADPVDGDVKLSAAEKQDQTQTAAFKRWFAGSKVVDSKGSPMVVYHGTRADFDTFGNEGGRFPTMGRGFYFTSSTSRASVYADGIANAAVNWNPKSSFAAPVADGANIVPVYLSIKNPLMVSSSDGFNSPEDAFDAKGGALVKAARDLGHDGIIFRREKGDGYDEVAAVAFKPEQIKSATGNRGTFDPDNADIRFSVADDIKKAIPAFDVKTAPKNSWAHYRGMAMQALGRRQIVDLYAEELPQLAQYDYLVQQMDAEKNDSGAEADKLAQDWGKLRDEKQLAELMHDATLAQIDPAKPMETGVLQAQYRELKARFDALTPEAQALYRQARDMYDGHYRKVQKAIKERIERSEMSAGQKRQIMAKMDEELFKKLKGVYFPLARFGQYVIVVKDANGEVKNVTRAETVGEAEEARKELHKAFPKHMGYTVGKVLKQAEFNAGRDAVGKGFMADLMDALDAKGIDDELRDTVAQLYLSSLPDLSWAKHGIHRKGTPGFSQDARRAFAQNMFHGARYLAKLRYADQLQDELIAMQEHVKAYEGVDEYDSIQAQQVVDEMVKRHEIMMNPKTNGVSTWMTSMGFVFHLGLSPASAMVNLSQTALVAYPMMGAKWGWGKASAALLAASQDVVKAKNDLSTILKGAELDAYERAVKDGTIDVTMAHDLAGISQGEDQKVFWKIRPVMRAASFMFHHAERFNRQATFIAAWRMAKEAGPDKTADQLYGEAKKLTYDSHFDYSAGNRPRMMQGNWQRVIFLFRQYSQAMVYTLSRNAYLSMKGLTPADRALARKNLGGILATHAAAAGVLGLPLVGPLLTAASFIGSDDDEPWDAEVAMQNVMADMVGPKAAEVMARGFSRLTPFDLSGRVALNKLILPDVQEGLEGKQWAESAMAAALGPVAGIGVNMARGFQKITEGHYMIGLEDMMPTALRAPLRAMRYAGEGAVDKTGVVITDEVGPGSIAGQALGFSPSEVRRATERKAAIMDYDRSLADRRSALVRQWAEAQMASDTDGVKDVMAEIKGFNQKNPNRKITMPNLIQSVRARRRRIEQAEDGVYLPKNREGAREAVRF